MKGQGAWIAAGLLGAFALFEWAETRKQAAAASPSQPGTATSIVNAVASLVSPAATTASPPAATTPQGGTGSAGASYGNMGTEIPNVAYQLGDDYVLEDGSHVSINAYNDAVSGDDPAAGAGLLDDDPTDSGNETWEGS